MSLVETDMGTGVEWCVMHSVSLLSLFHVPFGFHIIHFCFFSSFHSYNCFLFLNNTFFFRVDNTYSIIFFWQWMENLLH